MPLPTNLEIEAGFETENPSPQQAQAIIDLRAILVAAAEQVRDHVVDNLAGKQAIQYIQIAFSRARQSVVTPPTVITQPIV